MFIYTLYIRKKRRGLTRSEVHVWHVYIHGLGSLEIHRYTGTHVADSDDYHAHGTCPRTWNHASSNSPSVRAHRINRSRQSPIPYASDLDLGAQGFCCATIRLEEEFLHADGPQIQKDGKARNNFFNKITAPRLVSFGATNVGSQIAAVESVGGGVWHLGSLRP